MEQKLRHVGHINVRWENAYCRERMREAGRGIRELWWIEDFKEVTGMMNFAEAKNGLIIDIAGDVLIHEVTRSRNRPG